MQKSCELFNIICTSIIYYIVHGIKIKGRNVSSRVQVVGTRLGGFMDIHIVGIY